MKMFNITGWRYIYSFTFTQTLKSKSYKVSFIILCIISIAAMPVLSFISGGEKGGLGDSASGADREDIDDIDTVYVNYDENDEAVSGVVSEWKSLYEGRFEDIDSEEFDNRKKTVNDDGTYALIQVTSNGGLYNVDFIVGWESMIDTGKLGAAADKLGSMLEKQQVENVVSGAVEDELFESRVSGYVGDSENSYSGGNNMLGYMIQLGFVCVFIFILSFCGESIATSVVSEKAGKMVEYLMITVKPMAILVGKVLAAITTVLMQFFAMLLCGTVSGIVCNVLFDDKVSDFIVYSMEQFESSNISFVVEPLSILVAILFILGGILFYALIASLAGASVSKIEEVSEGIVLFTLILMIGAYMAIGLAMKYMTGGNVGETMGMFDMLVYLLPFSAPFAVPQNLIMGNAGYGIAAGSLIILYLAVVALIVLSSKVYEFMLFYNGAKLKVKDIIYIAMHGRTRGAR